MISNIFAFGAWVFQQFSFPTMANVFCLNGGPARAPIWRRVPQDAPQRRPKTPPICHKTPPICPKMPQKYPEIKKHILQIESHDFSRYGDRFGEANSSKFD